MPEKTKNPESQNKICCNCREELLQRNPDKCPYCGSTNIVSKAEYIKNMASEIEKMEKAGKYEDLALIYEKLEMWDMAGEVRRKAKTSYVISANINIGKVGTISMECPHCGASQPLSSKTNEVTCKYCGKNYIIPKKVLELL